MFLPCYTMGCLLQFLMISLRRIQCFGVQAAPEWVPHRIRVPARKLVHAGFLSMGCSSGQESALARDFHGLQLPQEHSLLLQGCSSQAVCAPLLHHRSPCAAGEPALVSGAPSPPPSLLFTDLCVYRAISHLFFSLLTHSCSTVL